MELQTTLTDISQKLRAERFPNEQSISQGIVLRILSELNWEVYDTTIVWPEFATSDGRRVDSALCDPPSKPKCFVEVKQQGKAEDGVRQALEYAFHSGVPFVVLTDGQTWSFYLPAEQGSYEERRVFKLDLFERTDIEAAEILQRYLERNRVVSGRSLEEARKEYRDKNRRLLARDAIPEAWKELVERGDELLRDLLVDAVESKAGVRPDYEDIVKFLNRLALPMDSLQAAPVSSRPAGSGQPPGQGEKGLISISRVADYLNRDRSSVHKVVKRLNIETVPCVSDESRGQRAHHITMDDFRKVKERVTGMIEDAG